MGSKDFWLDDPEWELLRRKAERRPIPKKLKQQAQIHRQHQRPKIRYPENRPVTNREDTEKEVVVNVKFTLPKIKTPNIRQFYKVHQRRVWQVGAGLVVIAGLVGVGKVLSNRHTSEEAAKPIAPQEQAQKDFNPLVPLEDLTDATGSQSKPEFKYDSEKKVLGYVADYNNASLTISQQKIPADFKSDPAKLMSIANSINATTPLDTQKGTAYIGKDEKTKSQTAIFATDEVLVFIRSNSELDEESWKFYNNQLNPSK